MGYLSDQNNEIIVDAILTKYGREKLASGQQLGIVKFALSDDEVDYALYNTNHPMGSDFFDIAIRKMPLLEAVPNSPTAFRYYLYSSKLPTTFSYTLSPQSSAYSVGLDSIGSTLQLGVSISPAAPNPSQIWYSARISSDVSQYISLKGIINQNIGMPQDLAKIVNTYGGTVATYQDSIIAYGHSFTADILTLPASAKQITITFDVANIPAAPSSIQILLDRNYVGPVVVVGN